MSENENIENEGGESSAPSVPAYVAVMLIVLLAATGATAIYFATNSRDTPGCALNASVAKAQYDAQKAQTDYNIGIEKHLVELRMETIKQCVTRGNIPVLVGGNVDCKVPK